MNHTPFWSNDPTILLNKDFIFELWPNSSMNYEQKLNAITRLIILITILGYIATYSVRILITGFVTLVILFGLYKMRKNKLTHSMLNNDEGFEVQGNEVTGLFDKPTQHTNTNPVSLESVVNEEFQKGNKKNPFSNVLLTEIMDDPERKAAPPAFDPNTEENITKNVKKAVQFMNPEIKNTDKQLYGDLWENFELDQSNRIFFSTANTKVVNDQGAFAQYLYNDLKYSAKESTPEGNLARVQDNYRYILY